MFWSDSSQEVKEFLYSSKSLKSFYEIVNDYNGVHDPADYTWEPEPCIYNEDLAILTLLALHSVRKNILKNCLISDEDIHTAIAEVLSIVKKIYEHSYLKYKYSKENEKVTSLYDEDAIRWVRMLFTKCLKTLNVLKDNTEKPYWEYDNEDDIKETLLNIIHDPILLDHLPMDLLAIIDKEYYTRTHKEFIEEKAMVSWFDIVDSLTEDQLENITPIKLFIYEALGNKFPRWTINTIKQKLTDKIKELKNQTKPPIINNFNAPIGQYAQNIEKQEYKN